MSMGLIIFGVIIAILSLVMSVMIQNYVLNETLSDKKRLKIAIDSIGLFTVVFIMTIIFTLQV